MTSAPTTFEPVDGLAYEQAIRALDQQAKVLDELRQRTATLITVTALVATFLGGKALEAPRASQGPRGLVLLALIMMLLGLGLAIFVLLPTRTRKRRQGMTTKPPKKAEDVVALTFSMNVEILIDRAEEAAPVQMTPRLDAARTLQLAWDENAPIISAKQHLFTAAGIALLAQSSAWIFYVALGRGVI